MKKLRMVVILMGLLMFAIAQLGLAEEAGEEQVEKKENKILKAGEIQVTAPREKEDIVLSPTVTTIDIEAYDVTGTPQNIEDILKDQAIIDFRGQSDLVPGYDSIYMRGFDPMRFAVGVDGLSIQRPGVWGNTQVNFATLPLWRIEKIEIMPGPHSVLYSGKSEGGTINLKTKTPKKYESLKPDLKVTSSFRSYNTRNHNLNVEGGAGAFVYGIGYQNYHTDGYLRNNETDIDNYNGSVGYILSSGGYINLDVTHTDMLSENTVKNAPSCVDYDPSYPETTAPSYYPWQDREYDRDEDSYRFTYKQPTPIGNWTLSAYYEEQDWDWSWFSEKGTGKTPEVRPSELQRSHYYLNQSQAGGRIQDEIKLTENQILTVGFDTVQMWREGFKTWEEYGYYMRDHKRSDQKAGYLQYEWNIIPRLTLTPGLRYEYVNLWFHNWDYQNKKTYITGEDVYIKRHRDQLVPKFFSTYELDDLSDVLRDTSVSLGVSKIWNPIPHCMPCPQDRPHGAWVKPEHGIGYDFIITRRLWKDINLKLDYSYSEIRDYVTYNSKYAKYTPSTRNSVTPGLEYSDYKINLDKVCRHGVEFELNGHLLNNLSFYLNYSFLELKNRGGEPAGDEEVDEHAKHRVNAGLRYNLFRDTLLMLDYKFQDKQIQRVYEEVATDEYVLESVPMSAYHVFDFAVEQTLFKKLGFVKDMSLKFYVNNLFDEEYENSRGYPMTDRTIGGAISFRY